MTLTDHALALMAECRLCVDWLRLLPALARPSDALIDQLEALLAQGRHADVLAQASAIAEAAAAAAASRGPSPADDGAASGSPWPTDRVACDDPSTAC